jgi:hypothetical protein
MAPVASFASQSYCAFSDRVAQLLDRIDCRLADTADEREAIFRLRYAAYLREGAIAPNFAATFTDPYDETDNARLFGLYLDGELASSIRLHVASAEHRDFPSRKVFADLLEPELDAGRVIVDPTRFITGVTRAAIQVSRTSPCGWPGWRPNISRRNTFWWRSGRSIRRSIGAPSTIVSSARRGPIRCWRSRSA